MDGVMTIDEARSILEVSSVALSHLELTIEPEDEFDILNERLQRYGFEWKEVNGDGNCVVRSIADQFWEDESRHNEVRRAGVAMLLQNWDFYKNVYDGSPIYRELTYAQYVRKIAAECQDIDPFFTQAICDAYHVRIIELVSNMDYCIAEFIPSDKTVLGTICLVSSSIHSDSMYAVED